MKGWYLPRSLRSATSSALTGPLPSAAEISVSLPILTLTTAVVKVDVAGERLISAAEGNGPVNALDVALRKDLGKYQKYIGGLKLIDYRVRILNGGTGAVTRVLIESEDERGDSWTTVGVSPNIIDASFQALMDSIVYKLVKAGAPV